jgi:hypothetical protein
MSGKTSTVKTGELSCSFDLDDIERRLKEVQASGVWSEQHQINISEPPEKWPSTTHDILREARVSIDEFQAWTDHKLGPALQSFADEFLSPLLSSFINAVKALQDALLPVHITRTIATDRGLDYDKLPFPEQVNRRFLYSSDPQLNGSPWGGKPAVSGRGIPLSGILSGSSIIDVQVEEVADTESGYRTVFTIRNPENEDLHGFFGGVKWLTGMNSKSAMSDDEAVLTFSNQQTVSTTPARLTGANTEFVELPPTSNSKSIRRCYDRDHTWLAWYEDKNAETWHSPAKIRDRWNRENKDSQIADATNGCDLVDKGIKKAREELASSGGKPKPR